jgi:hypothetical protein
MEVLTITLTVFLYGCGMYFLNRCGTKRLKKIAEQQERIVLLFKSVIEALEDFVEGRKITRSELESIYENIDALAELGYDFFEENGEYVDVIHQCEEQILQQESSDAIERVFSPVVEDIIHANLIHLQAITV